MCVSNAELHVDVEPLSCGQAKVCILAENIRALISRMLHFVLLSQGVWSLEFSSVCYFSSELWCLNGRACYFLFPVVDGEYWWLTLVWHHCADHTVTLARVFLVLRSGRHRRS